MAERVSGTEFAAISLAAAQGMGAWIALMPSLDSMTKGDIDDDQFRIHVRNREIIVGAVTLAVGALGSYALRSSGPIIASAVIIAALAAAYEVALRLDTGEITPFTMHDTDTSEGSNQ